MTRHSSRGTPAATLLTIAWLIWAPAASIAAQESRRPEAGATHHRHHEHGSSPGAAVALLSGLGTWHHAVSTRVPHAQRFFDQGLRLAYAFNHDEAERSFAEAARLDSTCAMCWWGVAYAVGPNINLPMTADAERRALAAIREAQRRGSSLPERERAYIDAMARRFGDPVGDDRAARDSAYASAMAELARRYPSDLDAQVLHADAMLNLRPWNQWTRDGEPHPGTLELVGILERVIDRAPDHAGACHLYVHAVEASSTPERALPCAERLPRLMPGAGHVVHMPAHVYFRVGRYAEAARANVAAVSADRRYLASSSLPRGIYSQFYAPHNTHFLWATHLLAGQRRPALEAARTLGRSVSTADARENASLEAFLTATMLTHARFAAWDSVLAQPAPPNELRYLRGMWHYARGLAHAARGNAAAGAAELDTLRAIAASVPATTIIILNPAPAVLELAADVLASVLARQSGDGEAAVRHLQSAVRREDALTYDEPPPWYHSTRHMLGTTHLALGNAAAAEAAFREDLRTYRENGWSLAGLERALRRQGRTADADAVRARLSAAWRGADVPLAETPVR
jgi:tetratricopeptide (TPR) repeat protein